jgi:hypothetical protein
MKFSPISDEKKEIIEYFFNNSDLLLNGKYDSTKSSFYFNTYWTSGAKEEYQLDIINRLRNITFNKKMIFNDEVRFFDTDKIYRHFIYVGYKEKNYLVFSFCYLRISNKWLLDDIYDHDPLNVEFVPPILY